METVLLNANSTTEIFGMDFGWDLDSYDFTYGTSDLARTAFMTTYSAGHGDGR
jgi:hypothetical protein